MNKRENVYARVDEKFVKTVVVYANSSKVLFFDAEFKNPVLTTELQDLFLKGITISVDSALHMPVSYTSAGVVLADSTTYTATAPVEE